MRNIFRTDGRHKSYALDLEFLNRMTRFPKIYHDLTRLRKNKKVSPT